MPPNKGNSLKRTNASSKVGAGRRKDKDKAGAQHQRSAQTIQRLKLYSNSKPVRNKDGKVVGGSFIMKDRAGDRSIDATTGRIQPDRRWFGNTRVVDPKQLDAFRSEMANNLANPYSVVLKRKKIPMGLLSDVVEFNKKPALLEQEPFEQAFGKQAQRKRVKLEQLLVSRDTDASKQQEHDASYAALLQTAQQSQCTYEQVNTAEGIVPWGRDTHMEKSSGEGIDWRHEKKHDLFYKGQSKRIWGELWKVVDCSDVILHVIDARDVPGTRCNVIENHVAKNASHKHLVFVLNKIDLVPNWVAKRWMGELAKDRPTIAFHASMTHAFGKGALISLLRQFGKLHEDKKQISVGVIGYPNVGKSSVINTLISKKSCKVAPIPGETKIWQYITLFKRISLIDCPGVVVDTAGDTETDSVLKGVVRAERLESPQDFVDAIVDKVKREHIAAQYKIPKDGPNTWNDSTELLETIARRCGRLLKGGDPCLRSAAIMMINDYQRGRLPHYVAPPELKEQLPAAATTFNSAGVAQDLEQVGEEHMQSVPAEEIEPSEEAEQVADHVLDVSGSTESELKESSESVAMALIGAGEWDE